MSTIYTEVKKVTRTNRDYVQMAIDTLVNECDWVQPTDENILIFKSGHDYVAIPDYYYDEGTEFKTTLDVWVTLTSDKKSNYVAVVVED